MRRLPIEMILPVVFVLVAAFVFGFLAPDVRANGIDIQKWMASLDLMPQRVDNGGNRASGWTEGGSLPLVDTYSSVMERIKADYFDRNTASREKKINERDLTYDAIRGMLHALGDPFTRFLDPDEYKKMREENEGNFTGIGAQLDTNKKGEVYVKEPLEDTPAYRAGVKSNDVIVAVNGKPIKGKEIEDVVKMIRGKEGTVVKLTLRRPGQNKLLNFAITREIVQFRMVKSRMLDSKNKIGYIRLYQFNEKSDEQFDQALAALEKSHMKGLVFDLRGNPGGLLQIAVDIGSRFIESGPVVIIQERGGQRNPMYVEEDKHNHRRYPLVVLVDKSSASASEIVSGAIKDDGVGTLVGTTTFGKGRVQTIMPLRDGSAVAITTAKYLTPKGIDIHKKGIKPDIIVEASDNFDPNDPATDIQLAKGIQVIKVKLGILPKSVLEKMQPKTAKKEEVRS
ncbi:MAG: S41 family peptidase [Armatimonadetes bacterium]|nr:S41 family peptidase [Armatimonadota bacterium]